MSLPDDKLLQKECRSVDSQQPADAPSLRVQMMGAFSVMCGAHLITDAQWRRPAARRLFQYFILHQGTPLQHERILDDLWPDSDPDAARASFKTVYSWMRNAIEPALRPKSPSRYVQVEQEVYTFNPTKDAALVQCDVTDFERIVQATINWVDDHDVRPLSTELIAALETWQPLLPELTHEAWTIAPRERLQSLYVQGCLYAARTLLDSGMPERAIAWAERALAVAPWSEEALQTQRCAQEAIHTGAPLLPRLWLIRRIQRALRTSNVHLLAPAGYGKSTLLRTLVAYEPQSDYLALTPADADLAVLKQRIEALPTQIAVVGVDDVHHLADAPESASWLAEWLHHRKVRSVLGGRIIPPPLAARPEDRLPAVVLTSDDLAFQPGESKALLRELDGTLATQWCTRTQGWPLALALLANWAPHEVDLDAASSTRDALFDYLAHNVFATLPVELSEFVKLSALPLRFDDRLLAEILERALADIVALRSEVQRRGLFLEAAEAQGWFKYHDFVRDYVCSQVDATQRSAIAGRLVAHFEALGDLHMAVEHAVDGQLYAQAAQLMSAHGGKMLLDLGWLHSYQRWLAAIPASVQVRYPLALAQLGFALVYQRQHVDEGLRYLEQAQTLADALDELTAHEVGLRRATAFHLIGQPERALPLLLAALAYRDFPLRSQIRGGLYLAAVYARLNRLRDASLVYRETKNLLEQLEDAAERQMLLGVLRHNRGAGIEAVRGDFTDFEQTLHLNLQNDAGRLAALEMDYVGYCILHENLGEWEALADDLRQIETTRRQQSEDASADYVMTPKWELFYWAALYVGRREFATAQPLIDRFMAQVTDAEAVACGEWLQAWTLRVQERHIECIGWVDALPTQFDEPARFYRAAATFERAAAALCAERLDWNVHIEPHIRFHMQIGAKHYLLRWRLLLALTCYSKARDGQREGAYNEIIDSRADAMWRKHVRFIHAALTRYGYDRLLNQREPELAGRFWALCLAEEFQPERALTALQELGCITPISDLLLRSLDDPSRQCRLIMALAAIDKEEAIPFLEELAQSKCDGSVAVAIDQALKHLEALSPPTLHVKLLGAFSLQRGDKPVTNETWQRPGVRRLFLYFCLYHGRPLTLAQILEDLWPTNDQQSALAAFRTAYSRLRTVLEPHLRKRTAMRYFIVTGDRYIFDPHRTLTIIDSERLVHTVQAALKQGAALEETQLNELLAALTTWDAPLVSVAYESWAIHAIERLTERFADGCLLAAEQLLVLERLSDATLWAERGVTVAPWREECWQTLIRSTARQGHRTLALKHYERAVAALNAELGAPPSPQTITLAEHLRRNESV
ncbi:MAG: BTAD domain-containing putative transcriptional regulator [Caldilinea sp.]